MSSRPRKGPAGTPVTDRLKALTAAGALTADLLQLKAAAVLDRVANELAAQNGSRGFLSGLFGSSAQPVKGLTSSGRSGVARPC